MESIFKNASRFDFPTTATNSTGTGQIKVNGKCLTIVRPNENQEEMFVRAITCSEEPVKTQLWEIKYAN